MRKALVLVIFTALGCGSSKPAAAPTPASAPSEQRTETSLTAQQCTDAGGEVVGDIGDGAIHKPDYKCEKSGAPPMGQIAAEPGKPTAIEGAVCCK